MVLKGTMFLTDKIENIYSIPFGTAKIISMDEDGILQENKEIIGGTCLLPPIEAKIAEVDGNEPLYDQLYHDHLLADFQQQFVSALLAFLYRGGRLIFFLPEIGLNTIPKFIFHFYQIFGIHIGYIGSEDPRVGNFYFDQSCVPMWLNMIYTTHTIGPEEFLLDYPADAYLSNIAVMQDLCHDLKIYGTNWQERFKTLIRHHKLIHKNKDVQIVLQMED